MDPSTGSAAIASGPGDRGPADRKPRSAAFSLLEVVVALGLCAIGVVALLGLFNTLAGRGSSVHEGEEALQAAAMLSARLRAGPFAEAATGLVDAADLREDESGDLQHPPFYSSRHAEKVGRSAETIWTGAPGERYFELVLVRDEALSPSTDDGTAAVLAFLIRVRWPVSGVGAKRTLLVPGVVRR